MTYVEPKYPAYTTRRGVSEMWKLAVADIRRFNAIDDMIKNSVEKMMNDVEKVVYKEANAIMLESKLEYAPVKTGRLRASGRVGLPTKTGNLVSVDLGYYASYADFVHEHHRTKSKFLEKPFEEAINSGVLEERIARGIMKVWGF